MVFGEQFRRLPNRLQDLWFQWLFSVDLKEEVNKAVIYAAMNDFYTDGCESPIEVILYNSLYMAQFDMTLEERYECDFFLYLNIEPQYEIKRKNGRKYRVDFYIDHDCLVEGKKGLVIECDGHEFHEKTKEQVVKRNERDMELKMMGYDVLHFSGSQIFSDPIKYAYEIIEYFREHFDLDYKLMEQWDEEYHKGAGE